MFYNARWYDPYITQFSQPDSIVPNLYNPQDWNRYSYARDNPHRYTDPSGHTSCEGPNGECDIEYSTPTALGQLRARLRSYGVKLTGDWRNHVSEQWAVFFGVEAVGWRLAAAGYGTSATGAFKNVYGAVHFQWGCGDDCRSKDKNGKAYGNEGGAFAAGWQANNGDGYNLIKIATMLDDGGIRGMRQMVHELGHIYDYAKGTSGTMPDDVYTRDSLRPNGYWYDGTFYEQDDVLLWQMHPLSMSNGDSRSETFADIFVAWTLDAWNTNPANADAVQAAQDWMP
jgi:hypothetical protein